MSCCSIDRDNESRFLKELLEIAEDGTSTRTLLTYNGAKLVNIDGVCFLKDFTYENSLITKIKTLDKVSKLSSDVEYSYNIDQLIQIRSPNNYVINYSYNTDATVSYERKSLKAGNINEKLYHGTLYFSNKNLIKDERALDNTPVGFISKCVTTFQFDDKKNPIYSIVGYNKLLDYSEMISINNTVNRSIENTVTNAEGQIISSLQFYKSIFKYNTDGYLTEQLMETVNSRYLKSQYFY